MKRGEFRFVLSGILLISVIVFSFVSVGALEFPGAENRYVNDFAGVLNDGQRAELIELFGSVDKETSAEIVFVSLESIDGAAISDYAIQLGQEWGVGKADKDNGFIILYVSDLGKIFAASGYGVEGILPDSKIGRLLDENYVPLRDSGDLGGGIVEFSKKVSGVMFDNAEEIMSGESSGKLSTGEIIWQLMPFLIWVLIFVFFLIGNYKRARKKEKYSDFPWWMLLFMPSGRGRGFGGGLSGGFGGGFGGGGFGGGGAGR